MGKIDRNKCIACPLHSSHFVGGDGPIPASIMVVGTAPGESEERVGKPFVGKRMEVVREIIDGLGLTDRAYFTNLVPRRPVGKGGGNRRPTASEVSICSSHLIREIERVKPDLIVTVGSEPTRFLMGKGAPDMKTLHGLVIGISRFGMRVSIMPVYDPAYVARVGGLLSSEGRDLVADLQSITEYLEQGLG